VTADRLDLGENVPAKRRAVAIAEYERAAALVAPLAALLRRRHATQRAIDATVRAGIRQNAEALDAVNEALRVLRNLTTVLGNNAGTSKPLDLDQVVTAAQMLLDLDADEHA
jgi:hypothetical protein